MKITGVPYVQSMLTFQRIYLSLLHLRHPVDKYGKSQGIIYFFLSINLVYFLHKSSCIPNNKQTFQQETSIFQHQISLENLTTSLSKHFPFLQSLHWFMDKLQFIFLFFRICLLGLPCMACVQFYSGSFSFLILSLEVFDIAKSPLICLFNLHRLLFLYINRLFF